MPGSFRIEKLLSRRVSRIVIVILSLLVLALSLTPRPERVLGALSAYDKIGHFMAYVALGFFALRAVDRRGPLPFFLTIAGCTLFGGIIEIIQPFVGRTMELADFLVDLAGSVAGAALVVLLTWNARRGEGNKPQRSTAAKD
jgi:VanZ family protein